MNDLLAAELEGPVHALSMQCKTPEQWAKSGGAINPSPKCLGGMAREAKEKEQQGAAADSEDEDDDSKLRRAEFTLLGLQDVDE